MSEKKICSGNLNPKKDKCGVDNPMNCTTKQKCQFGHSITHSLQYQKSEGCEKAKCEHDRTVKILEECYPEFNHSSPFKCKIR